MKTAGSTAAAMMVGVLALICCAGLPLLAAIGTTALAAWFSKSAYVLIPATVIGAGLIFFWFQRRRVSAQGYCRPEALNKASKHE